MYRGHFKVQKVYGHSRNRQERKEGKRAEGRHFVQHTRRVRARSASVLRTYQSRVALSRSQKVRPAVVEMPARRVWMVLAVETRESVKPAGALGWPGVNHAV